MEGRSGRGRRWSCVKERLRFLGCCGAIIDHSDEERRTDLGCLLGMTQQRPAAEEMDLASALAAERQCRASETPVRVSLMRLLEEEEDEVDSGGCCVCMGRRKGAAFIPCGHTYCRVCARELWINRGACPLCNQPVLEILDIF